MKTNSIFYIKESLNNNLTSKVNFENKILHYHRHDYNKLNGQVRKFLLKGRYETPLQISLINITDSSIEIESKFEDFFKVLIKNAFFISCACVFTFILNLILQFNFNRELKTILILYPILISKAFVIFRIVLAIKHKSLTSEINKIIYS